jgi:hypothetical protein
MQEHPRKYSSVSQLWVVLKEEEALHVDAAAPVALGYGDVSVPMSLGLHFLGQQFPR